jgi:streptogramin lyase
MYASTYDDSSLCRYDTNTGRSSSVELPFEINDFTVAPDGSLWTASAAGFVTRLTGAYFDDPDYADLQTFRIGEGLVRRSVNPARIEAAPDGSIWIFVRDVGLYRLLDGEWKYFGVDGLEDATAFAVDSRGRVWAGLPGKLMRYDGEQWETFPQNCICPSQLFAAPDDAVWFVNGCQGVYRFDGQTWTEYDSAALGGFVPSRILSAPDGAIWFFGSDAAARFKP